MTIKLILQLLIPLALVISCRSGSKKASLINCYRYANAKDTITLKLIHVGKSVTGTLAYEVPEKNTSKGTILGSMDGDLLVANFTPFVDSTIPRQVAFKLMGDYFVEGIGETYMDNGRVSFKNRNNLFFNDTIRLNEFVCQQ